MLLTPIRCPECNSEDPSIHTTYTVLVDGKQRHIHHCKECGNFFSETKNTPLEGLRTPLSKIILVIDALNDGIGINAACRTFKVAKNSIYLWQERLAGVKETLILYSLCHQFLQQLIEGDELYTKVEKNKPPSESEGWTIVLMDRATRFIWELRCGEKDPSTRRRKSFGGFEARRATEFPPDVGESSVFPRFSPHLGAMSMVDNCRRISAELY